MNLVIDIGNTNIKSALFKADQLIADLPLQNNLNHLFEFCIKTYELQSVIISSVINIDQNSLLDYKKQVEKFIIFDHHTSIPVENCYESPETLGKDRLAACIGAAYLYPGKNCLVIDSGTAITYDLITKHNTYLGGNISPGLQTRFNALHHFTNKLPLCFPEESNQLIGKNTHQAIINGVQNGMVFEIEGNIQRFKEKFEDLTIMFTGGDANFFDKKLNCNIFVNPNLVLIGLNRILNYNVKN